MAKMVERRNLGVKNSVEIIYNASVNIGSDMAGGDDEYLCP